MLVPISLDRLCPSTSTTAKVSRHPKLCHPDRSVAQWRDLQFNFRSQRKSRGRVSGFRFAINANGSRYALSKNTSGEALGREGRTADPSASLGMTKGEGCAHLSSSYRGMDTAAGLRRLCRKKPAIDRQDMAGHHAGRIGRQENRSTHNLFRLSFPTHWSAVHKIALRF